MLLRAILLDKDGTLVDFNATWGVAIEQVMRRISEGDQTKFTRLAAFSRYDISTKRIDPASPLISECSADYGPIWAAILGKKPTPAFFEWMDKLCAEEVLHSIAPIGSARRVVADLAERGFMIGIITNDSEASTRMQCDRLGLLPYLTAVIGYDSGHGRKPEAGQVLAFLRDHDVLPQEAALVGDTLHDLNAARAAGVMRIAVLSGFAAHEDVAAHADHVIADIDSLPDLIDRLGGYKVA